MHRNLVSIGLLMALCGCTWSGLDNATSALQSAVADVKAHTAVAVATNPTGTPSWQALLGTAASFVSVLIAGLAGAKASTASTQATAATAKAELAQSHVDDAHDAILNLAAPKTIV